MNPITQSLSALQAVAAHTNDAESPVLPVDGDRRAGGALVVGDRVVHLAAFRVHESPRFGRHGTVRD